MFYFYIYFNLFAVERTLSASDDRLVTKFVIAGSAVSFNCTLDESCVNQSISWIHYSPLDTKPALWYREGKLEPSGVTVDEDATRGWSVLNITNVTLKDRGRFLCQVIGIDICQMNFNLTVAGIIY